MSVAPPAARTRRPRSSRRPFPITSSSRNFVVPGSTRPQRRLTARSPNPSASLPLRAERSSPASRRTTLKGGALRFFSSEPERMARAAPPPRRSARGRPPRPPPKPPIPLATSQVYLREKRGPGARSARLLGHDEEPRRPQPVRLALERAGCLEASETGVGEHPQDLPRRVDAVHRALLLDLAAAGHRVEVLHRSGRGVVGVFRGEDQVPHRHLVALPERRQNRLRGLEVAEESAARDQGPRDRLEKGGVARVAEESEARSGA